MLRLTRRKLLMGAAVSLAGSLSGRANAATTADLKFEIYKTSRGRFRWRLKAANNKTIAQADEAHARKETCQEAIAQIMQKAATAEIQDLTG